MTDYFEFVRVIPKGKVTLERTYLVDSKEIKDVEKAA